MYRFEVQDRLYAFPATLDSGSRARRNAGDFYGRPESQDVSAPPSVSSSLRLRVFSDISSAKSGLGLQLLLKRDRCEGKGIRAKWGVRDRKESRTWC